MGRKPLPHGKRDDSDRSDQPKEAFLDRGRRYSLYAQNIIDTTREPLVVLNSELRVSSANRAFYEFFKVDPAETEGEWIYDLGDRQWDIPRLRELLEKVLPARMSFDNYEVTQDFPRIGRKTLLLNARQIKGDETPNREPLILVAFEDFTERMKLEQERDQALKAREELVAVVSHEIKNPLTIITTSLDLLKRTLSHDGQGQTERLIEQIRSATLRMGHIVSDLLDVTKIESDRFIMRQAAVDVPELITEVVAVFGPIAAKKSIHLEHGVSPDVVAVWCDRDWIFQVLPNLLANAVKFTGDGGTIRIDVDRTEDRVRFQVKDSGCGIPADQLAHVFERFWQAKHNQYLGVGLGLYIAKSVVEAHGGKIGLSSKEGEGSIFYFTLAAAGALPVRKTA